MKLMQITPKFVDFIPERLDEGMLYITLRFRTASHKCCCGCGAEVVTPLTPTDWSLKQEGSMVSLKPSIGNWSYPCQSHYFIQRNRVVWAGAMTGRQIARGRESERAAKAAYFKTLNQIPNASAQQGQPVQPSPVKNKNGLSAMWNAVKAWFSI